MNEEKLKIAFSKIKEEINLINSNIKKLEKKSNKKVEVKGNSSELIKIEKKVQNLELNFDFLEKSTFETIERIKFELNQKIEEEISSLRLELTDLVMNNSEQKNSPGNDFKKELQNFNY